MFLYVLCAISCCDKTEHIGAKNAWSGIGNDCDLALLGSVATDILSWWNYPNVSSKTSSSVVIKTCFPPVQSKKCGVAILKVRTIFHSESPHDLPFWPGNKGFDWSNVYFWMSEICWGSVCLHINFSHTNCSAEILHNNNPYSQFLIYPTHLLFWSILV